MLLNECLDGVINRVDRIEEEGVKRRVRITYVIT